MRKSTLIMRTTNKDIEQMRFPQHINGGHIDSCIDIALWHEIIQITPKNGNRMIPSIVPQFLTVEEVAGILRVATPTVRKMILDKKIHAVQPSGKRGSYRIPMSALDTLLGIDQSQDAKREVRSINVSHLKN